MPSPNLILSKRIPELLRVKHNYKITVGSIPAEKSQMPISICPAAEASHDSPLHIRQ
jgi:hypothetical protein